jgi:hypothetical protein
MNHKLRQKIARIVFRREFNRQEPQRRSIPFDKAKSIGIIYDSTEESSFEHVKKYVKEMREQFQKDVLALGYYDNTELPPMRFAKLGLDFFTRKDLNFFYKPVSAVVKNFIHREFDILIDLHTGNGIPFRYVTALSKAKFKIGKYDKTAIRFYDFMVCTGDVITVPQFIQQVNAYLHQLKNENTPA